MDHFSRLPRDRTGTIGAHVISPLLCECGNFRCRVRMGAVFWRGPDLISLARAGASDFRRYLNDIVAEGDEESKGDPSLHIAPFTPPVRACGSDSLVFFLSLIAMCFQDVSLLTNRLDRDSDGNLSIEELLSFIRSLVRVCVAVESEGGGKIVAVSCSHPADAEAGGASHGGASHPHSHLLRPALPHRHLPVHINRPRGRLHSTWLQIGAWQPGGLGGHEAVV